MRSNTKSDLVVTGSIQQTSGKGKLEFAEAFVSVEAVMICDISGSMIKRDVATEGGGYRSRWEECNVQLARLQKKFPGRLAVVAFSDEAMFLPGGVLPAPIAGTNLTGALTFVAPADGCGIKFIVASDGCPNDPEGALNVAKTMSPVDTIYIGSDEGGREFMEKLARASGGKSVEAGVDLLEEVVTKLLGDGK